MQTSKQWSESGATSSIPHGKTSVQWTRPVPLLCPNGLNSFLYVELVKEPSFILYRSNYFILKVHLIRNSNEIFCLIHIFGLSWHGRIMRESSFSPSSGPLAGLLGLVSMWQPILEGVILTETRIMSWHNKQIFQMGPKSYRMSRCLGPDQVPPSNIQVRHFGHVGIIQGKVPDPAEKVHPMSSVIIK